MRAGLAPIILAPTGIPTNGLVCHHDLWKPNILLQSNTFDTGWITANLTAVQAASQTSGVSGSLAWKIVENDSAATSFSIYQAFTFAAGVYTLSFWCKADERTWARVLAYDDTAVHLCYFNLSTGAKGTETSATGAITASGDGYLCSITFTANAGTGYVRIYLAEGDGDVTFDGTGSAPYTEDDPGLYIADAQLYPFATLPAYEATTTLQSFTDLSGNGYTLTRGSNASAADTNDPTVLGPGCSFVDDDYMLTGNLAGVTPSGPWTAIVALKSEHDGASYPWSLSSASDATEYACLTYSSATTLNSQWYGGATKAGGNITVVDNTAYLFSLVANSTLTLTRLDNGAVSIADPTTPVDPPRVCVGALGRSTVSGHFNDGTIYESLLYNRILSLAEQKRIHRAIKAKWAARGVTIT